MHYLIATPAGRPACFLQFENELDADDYQSRNPEACRTADAPSDISGFRHFQTTGPGRILCGKVRALTEDEKREAGLTVLDQFGGYRVPIAAGPDDFLHMTHPDAGARREAVIEKLKEIVGTEPYTEEELMNAAPDPGFNPPETRYPGPNENPSPQEVAARFAATLPPFDPVAIFGPVSKEIAESAELLALTHDSPDAQRIVDELSGDPSLAGLITLVRLLAETECPVAVLKAEAQRILETHGLVPA